MLTAGLSTDQAPPPGVPFLFFLTAPLFGLLAAAMLIAAPAGQFGSRWNPALLATVHLLLPGLFVTVMIGAVQQMLPVLAGTAVKSAVAISSMVHVLWSLGVVSLASGFFWPELLLPAVVLLVGALLVYLAGVGLPLLRPQAANATVRAMQLAHVMLLLAITAGVWLALGQAGYTGLMRPVLTDSHALLGLAGWILMLVMGVAFQVIPMFYITGPFAPRWRDWLVPALFCAVLIRVGSVLVVPSGIASVNVVGLIADLVGAAVILVFCVGGVVLLNARRRKIPDPGVWLWKTGFTALGSVAVLWAGGAAGRGAGAGPMPEWLVMVGTLIFILGFGVSVVVAMLYKIVAFLVWFHLQGVMTRQAMAGGPMGPVPTMKEIVPDRFHRLQARVHLSVIVVFIGAVWWPQLWPLAGVMLGADCVLLGWTVSRGWWVYRKTMAQFQTTSG